MEIKITALCSPRLIIFWSLFTPLPTWPNRIQIKSVEAWISDLWEKIEMRGSLMTHVKSPLATRGRTRKSLVWCEHESKCLKALWVWVSYELDLYGMGWVRNFRLCTILMCILLTWIPYRGNGVKLLELVKPTIVGYLTRSISEIELLGLEYRWITQRISNLYSHHYTFSKYFTRVKSWSW